MNSRSLPADTVASSAHWAAIIELSHEAIVSKNSDDIIIGWNRGAEHLFGYTAHEIIGQPASILSAPAPAGEGNQLSEQPSPTPLASPYPDLRMHKKGSLLEVTVVPVPWEDENGQWLGTTEIVRTRDAQRKEMEECQLLAAIVDSSHDAIISKDLSGIITSWNAGAENLFQYRAKEVIGKPITILIPPGREGEEAHILDCLKRGEKISHFETLRMAKDGSLLNISLTVSPIKDKDGKVIGASKVARDITEQKRLTIALQSAQNELKNHVKTLEDQVQERTAKLQQAVSELESFAYSISHDMRAPLRSMQSFAYYLKEDYQDKLGLEGIEYLNRIIKAANRMDCLIRDVLTFSQVGRTDLPSAPVDVEQLLQGIFQSYPQFQPPCADITVEGPFPRVLGNEASLVQCFTNLLSNAVKFTGPGVAPKIRIWAERKQNCVRFWVEDNGIGIAPEYHEKIFGIFQRLSSRYEGTGMGLAIVQRAAQRMSGHVGVESAEGEGSRFWLEVNLAEPVQGELP